jgi:hypothetical protein
MKQIAPKPSPIRLSPCYRARRIHPHRKIDNSRFQKNDGESRQIRVPEDWPVKGEAGRSFTKTEERLFPYMAVKSRSMSDIAVPLRTQSRYCPMR